MEQMENEFNKMQEEEYFTRKVYIKTDYKGCMSGMASLNFHPNLFYGSRSEYEEIIFKHFMGKENEFKIIGTNVFNTREEYNNFYGIKN